MDKRKLQIQMKLVYADLNRIVLKPMPCWSGLLIHSFLLCVISDVISVSLQNHINASIHNKHDGIAYVNVWIRVRACMAEAGHTFTGKKKLIKITTHTRARVGERILFSFALILPLYLSHSGKILLVLMWMRTCHRINKRIIALLFYTWTLTTKHRHCTRTYIAWYALHCCDPSTHTHRYVRH